MDCGQPDHRDPPVGRISLGRQDRGRVDFAGRQWHWVATVSQTPVEGLRRIDIEVRREATPRIRRWSAWRALSEPPRPPPGRRRPPGTPAPWRRTRATRRTSDAPCAARGFTLLEILVAVAILAIMSVMAYRGGQRGARIRRECRRPHGSPARSAARDESADQRFPHAGAATDTRADRRRLSRRTAARPECA